MDPIVAFLDEVLTKVNDALDEALTESDLTVKNRIGIKQHGRLRKAKKAWDAADKSGVDPVEVDAARRRLHDTVNRMMAEVFSVAPDTFAGSASPPSKSA